MDAGQVAASTVLGAFALITARNSLKKNEEIKPDLNVKDDDTIETMSSNSVSSFIESSHKLNAHNLRCIEQSINGLKSGFEVVSSVATDLLPTPCFSFVHEKSEKMFVLDKTASGIDIVVGAAQTGKGVSVIISSDVLKLNLNAVRTIGSQNLSSVWHIACSDVEMASLKLYSDLSIIKNINFTTIISSTAEEVFKNAILAETVSSMTGLPIAHVFDGVNVDSQKTTLKCKLDDSQNIKEFDNIEDTFDSASKALFGESFRGFDYFGLPEVETVFITFGPVAQVLLNVADNIPSIGILNVKLVNPFNPDQLLRALPLTVKRICVVEYSSNRHDLLYTEVTAALWSERSHVDVFSTRIDSKQITDVDENVILQVVTNASAQVVDRDLTITKTTVSSFEDKISFMASASTLGSVFGTSQHGSVAGKDSEVKEISVWADQDERFDFATLEDKFGSLQMTTKTDSITGIKRVDIKIAEDEKAGRDFTQFGLSNADMSVAFLRDDLVFFAATSVKPKGKLILLSQEESLNLSELSQRTKNYIFIHNISVYFSSTTETNIFHLINSENGLNRINIFEFRVSKMEENRSSPEFVSRRRALPSRYRQKVSNKIESYKLAWNVLFKESYKVKEKLRPSEHGVETATVTKFERLTPDEYNRNIFHIEFDISKTNLTYEIGDALGVFGENDEQKVDEFIKGYDLNPDEIVALNARGEMNDNDVEFVSVRNLLLKKLDIFGKVQKRFYVELAQFATSRYERLKLLHTGTDDSEQFKIGGYETVTPAELLLQYKSCKLSIHDIIKIVPEIKARHYSISSSMKMSPTSVHLLVVAVDWVTPLGKKGEGQCTRFLKNLKVGQEVCVDIQQSVLRLPPNPEQPIVMAGLGTGMAPFRAFVQQRYFLKRMGYKIGPMVLYFGARHKAQEWLYGEELEKYEEMGLLRLGLAWSRDQDHKVYIQHKIKDDADLLRKYLKEKKKDTFIFVDLLGLFLMCVMQLILVLTMMRL